MSGSLDGRVALITGASGGIGKAIARRLATCGVQLFLMVERGFGRVLFVSSVAGLNGGVVGAH